MRRLMILLVLLAATVFVPVTVAGAGGFTTAPYSLNPRLREIGLSTGTVLDVSATKVLYKDVADPPMLNVTDRGDLHITTLPAVPGMRHDRGWLTPRGAVFTAQGDNPNILEFFEWSGGDDLIDLGTVSPNNLPVVRGSYVLWVGNGTLLQRRNLDSDVTVVITNFIDWNGDITESGDVVYADPGAEYAIVRYHDGVTTRLTANDAPEAEFPVTDGVNVVYNRAAPTPNEPGAQQIWLFDGTDNVALTSPVSYDLGPGRNVAVAGGWTAFLAVGNTGGQVWVRSPSGVLSQVSDFGGSQPVNPARIVAISPTGETAYTVNDILYLGAPGTAPIQVAIGVGDWASQRQATLDNLATYVDGHWLFAIAGFLFQLTDQPLTPFSVRMVGHGTVGIAPYGVICQGECDLAFASGAVLAVSAEPDHPGWRFDGWDGACADQPAQACWVTLDHALAVQARFSEHDTTAPVVDTPVSSFVTGSTLPVSVASTVPLVTSWTATDPDAEVVSHELAVSVNGGDLQSVPLANTAVPHGSFSGRVGETYQFQARATDANGNRGEWTRGSPIELTRLELRQLNFKAEWSISDNSSSWTGWSAWTQDPVASVSFSTTGAVVAIVAHTDLNRGAINIYVDDQFRQTVPTAYAGGPSSRIVASLTLGGGNHTVRLDRAGSTPGPIELDGAIILTSPSDQLVA
jgi:hypothetical protein